MFALGKIKFQYWIVGLATGLVLLLAAVFVFTVFNRFQQAAHTSAQEKFVLIGQRVSDNLQSSLSSHQRRAVALARGRQIDDLLAGRLGADDVLPALRVSVLQNPTVYSEFIGLRGGSFIQAVAVRREPLIVQALGAPPDTVVATRVSGPYQGTPRSEDWRFYSDSGQLLGERRSLSAYDPTQRPWYSGAQQTPEAFLTAPYTFSSTQRGGLTLASAPRSGAGAYGIDISLHGLPALLAEFPTSPNAFLALLDDQGRLLASHGRGSAAPAANHPVLQPARDASDPRVRAMAALVDASPQGAALLAPLAGSEHVVASSTLQVSAGSLYRVVAWAPVDDFTGPVDQARRDVLLITAALLLVLVPLALLGTRGISQALARMAGDSERLRHLDFSHEPKRIQSYLYEIDALGEAQSVMFHSIKERAVALELAQSKLSQLVNTGIELGQEQNRDKILRKALFGARDIAHCQAATLFLKTERQTLSFALRTSEDPLPSFELPLYDEHGQPVHRYVASHVVLSGETVVIDDIYSETRFDVSGTKKFSDESGMRVISTLNVPMKAGEGKVIGLIQMMNAMDSAGQVIPFDREIVSFVEALAAQAAVAIDNQNLLEAQKALMDSMIQIIAGAIDTKSPYTGGHCERVPELAMMLAERACEVQDGPLASFAFTTEDEWREFRIGAWLHDCGKVTTPEYVVDKATKLETIFNRIHEIRTRFEVLLRDAQIERLQAIHERGENAAEAEARYQARHAELLNDFAFLAECNLGGEFMAPDKVARIQHIANQPWLRHFDDRLGLSHEELKRYTHEPVQALPAREFLLADKPRHLFERPPTEALDARYGFKLKVPEHLYNHGEVYNLCIGRGTLTDEERFKINEHIIQTIVMLERMPLPPNLKRVPEYAGTHHETLVGTGYPRRLTQAELSVPSRIMAIADIFEALTASDRPYKKAKTLSESVKILYLFKKDRHIDPVLFDLFLTSGVYKVYADRFLQPEQIDTVDITPYLGPLPEALATA
jgi:HD-GYP domain-containing protein (c-di-GMP phosphodiesterase class II)